MSERKRVFMLVSYLVDDNDDMVSAAAPICATKSTKVAEAMVKAHLAHRNTTCSPAWDEEVKRVLPSALPSADTLAPEIAECLEPDSGVIERPADQTSEEVSIDNILSLVQF